LFGKAFEFYPARWISSGYLAEKVLINHGIDVPFFRDLPYDLQEFSMDPNSLREARSYFQNMKKVKRFRRMI